MMHEHCPRSAGVGEEDPAGYNSGETTSLTVCQRARRNGVDPTVKEVCKLIRQARSHWNAHENGAARRVRTQAMDLYLTLTPEQKDLIPQVLRQWLRYRSEFYLGQPKRKRKKAPNPVPARKPKKKEAGSEGVGE